MRRRDISADARWCCHFKDLLALLLSVGLVTKFTKDFRHLFLLFGKFAKKEGVAMLLLATSSSATTYYQSVRFLSLTVLEIGMSAEPQNS